MMFSSSKSLVSGSKQPSGDHFKITLAPLDLAAAYRLADESRNGAVVLMSGMVRDNTDDRPVVQLEYQAYEPMALKVFEQIAAEVRSQWPDVKRLVILHRIGTLLIGEISVLVAVGSPHRAEAFSACQYAIDTLKHNAPIWKKETFRTPDGDQVSEWTQGCVACPQPTVNE